MRHLKKIDVDDIAIYLKEQLQAIRETKDNNDDADDEDLLRFEGMVIFAYHFNIINAIQFSVYCDKIEDLKYRFD